MYAVIRAGGKQYKVVKGDVIEVERVKDGEVVEFVPLLVVDDEGQARTDRSELSQARVTGRVVGDAKGPKVDIFKYRNKTGYRRHTGHRQKYTTVQIEDIALGARRPTKEKKTARSAPTSKQEVESDGT